jgi:ferredoxin-type protein NapG
MFTRRQFLTGIAVALTGGLGGVWLARDKAQSPRYLRPPGALPENDFLAACIRCGLCVEQCPYDTLKLADARSVAALGTPYLLARQVPCYLCQGYDELKCIAVCPTPALKPVASWRDIRMGTAIINRDVCLAWQGTMCRACWHACPFPNEAIVFDERGRALVVAEQCIGCGICDHACITEPSSITIQPREIA